GSAGNATGLTVNNQGQAVLTGSGIQADSNTGAVTVAGTLDASNKTSGQAGGTVHVLANKIALVESTQVDVSGDAGGGTALIGGDYQGKGEVPNATQTFVGSNVSINADAISTGNGGKVILWADEATRFYGNISARGGNSAGNGGFVEVSGKQNLAFDGSVDVGASAGTGGQLLLDPTSVVIGADGTNDNQLDDGQILATDAGDVFFISATRLLQTLNTGNVTIAATNDITVNNDIDASTNTNAFDLELTAPLINLNASIISKGGNITFDGPVLLGSSETISTGAGAGNITFNSTLNAVNGAQELTLIAGTGNIMFGGAVGNSLTLPGNTSLTFRIQDINPGLSDSMSSFSSFTSMNDELYFSANDGIHGFELWKSNGTAAGTALVRDINPGADSSNLSNLTALNSTLYFSADNGSVGTELWKSDGTTAGTALVRDINPGADSSNLSNLTALNSTLYFSADNGSVGQELWKSNGTANGTQLVRDINPGAGSAFSSNEQSNFASIGNTLYFSADNGSVGTELWKSDGTAAGTQLVRDINPGAGSALSFNKQPNFASIGNTLYFSANNGSVGQELWRSDGTANGTTLVQDINPGVNSSDPSNLTALNGTLYFSANDGSLGRELWKSDEANGTALVQDINPGSGSAFSFYTQPHFAAVGNTLYFSADNGSVGTELWKSDGTPNGTQLVRDINPGMESSDLSNLTAFNGTLYFSANNGSVGQELWKSDGTPNGTQLVGDINPIVRSSNPSNLIALNGRLYFRAKDNSSGIELWSSNGVASPDILGSLSVTSTSATNLTANSTIVVDRINLTSRNITLNGNLSTSGTPDNSVTLSATEGDIRTRNINTSVDEGTGGHVTLSAQGNIVVTGDINAGGSDGGNGEGGSVRLSSTGGSTTVGNISTNEGGSIEISASGNITAGDIFNGGLNARGNGSITLSSTEGNIVVNTIDAGPGGIDITAHGLFRAVGSELKFFEEYFALQNSPDLISFLEGKGIPRDELINSQAGVRVDTRNLPVSIIARPNSPDSARIVIRTGGATKTPDEINGGRIIIKDGGQPFATGPIITSLGEQFVPSNSDDSFQNFDPNSPFTIIRNESYRILNIPDEFPNNVSGTVGAILIGAG
ncbi:MAG: ELWxxDGT repeat protein, partial [Cyanobacteriota bacterium]